MRKLTECRKPHSPKLAWSKGKPGGAPFLGYIDLGKTKGHRAARLGWYPDEAMDHPAKMNIALIQQLIRWFSEPGQTVLDPMCGVGSTIVEALKLGRNCVGVELENQWASIAARACKMTMQSLSKINDHVHLLKEKSYAVYARNARDLTCFFKGEEAQADLILFSPPFGPTGHSPGKSKLQDHLRASKALTGAQRGIGSHPEQIGSDKVKYGVLEETLERWRRPFYDRDPRRDTFLDVMMEIMNTVACVRPAGGLVVIHTKPFVKRAKVVRLDLDLVKLAAETRMEYLGYHLRQVNPSYFQCCQKKRNLDYPIINHEVILLFRRRS